MPFLATPTVHAIECLRQLSICCCPAHTPCLPCDRQDDDRVSPTITLTFIIPTPTPLCNLITADNAHFNGDNVEVDLTNDNLVADAYLETASISWTPNPIGASNYFDKAQWNGYHTYYNPTH